jgi:carbamoyltransferase
MDGSSAVQVEGKLQVAIAEERVTGLKREGGWRLSSEYCLSAAGLSNRDVSSVVISTCTDEVGDTGPEIQAIREAFPSASFHHVSHHLSHAAYGFATSPFDRALVVVSDAGGNTLERGGDRWWEASREQTSYYIATEDSIQLVDREFERPGAVGFGESFRAITYYLGWFSDLKANKTMALSGFGDAHRLGISSLFASDASGKLSGLLACDPLSPVGMVRKSMSGALSRKVPARPPDAEFLQEHSDLAALMQMSYESALIDRVGALCEKYSVRNVCLSGGVAYNCQANSALARVDGLRTWVPAAPGDTGQSLGNCIALSGFDIDRDSYGRRFLGGDSSVRRLPFVHGSRVIGPVPLSAPSAVIASHLLQSGVVIGNMRGPSEFGARALGNRSIFVDPTDRAVATRLNAGKERESFLPFAGAILEERLSNFFTDTMNSPYMQYVHKANSEGSARLKGVLHVDGTSRMQTVDSSPETAWLRELLEHQYRHTGIPVVLNTSLNGGGKPIAEVVADALPLLEAGLIDVLLVGEHGYFLEVSYARYRELNPDCGLG